MPRLNRIIETALYVDDLVAARSFYSDTLELEIMFESPTLVAFNVGGSSTLLLFKRGASLETQHLSGGEIPPHDAQGRIHVCFAIDADQMQPWTDRLARAEVAIEGRTEWPRGGLSIYFRDPDENLLELLTPGCWVIY
ncbi:glyoxalase [Pseudomonas coronafaciens pv. porri]|uniref:Glyoxalase n=1 Tax=Pseudomonas coronafaciens pv. porri TaxID=83964 RepID=A0ABR5JT17_9PSED|nr:VOC family protein [Pseudomonas coronafaciens]KOP57609.1 glyoxalase [Pseudomonas coronafaciens pv. porri]KOP60508.1 glyoxalase [Pseudomonas coronafaciens pv. porri]KPY21842.1 Glyoxalase/bleomycin resistance protein/dioxygenase [Pseudomonas coronafaciens pv. porri]RMU79836.1 Glyoxalase/bleomycin resistance protein/dioxygenase [Pseudomonas coronafaciens pv. porri]RMV96913.1 Glyoxalase/bleomycin resistance protein/dioxygenase [Pseudomonas coronafaciens pv. porri]